jgi:superfamily I DNA/RNA helicase
MSPRTPQISNQILRVAEAVLEGVKLEAKELRPHKTGVGEPVVLVEAGTEKDEADWVAQVGCGG